MCTPSGRGTLPLQEQIWGQLGVNWFFPHRETLFFGGQLGTKLTHLEPSWCQLGSTWTPICSSKPTWADLERTWANLETQRGIKRNKKVQISNGPIKQMLFSIFSRSRVLQNEQFSIKNRRKLTSRRLFLVCSGDFLGFMSQHRGILRPTWANLSQHEPTWPNLIQHKPT